MNSIAMMGESVTKFLPNIVFAIPWISLSITNTGTR